MHSSNLLLVAGLLGTAAAQSQHDIRSTDLVDGLLERDILAASDDSVDLGSRGLLSGISKAANKIKGGAPAAKKIDTRPARTPNKLQKKPPVAKPPKVAKPTNKLQKKPPTNIGKNFRRDFDDDSFAEFVRDLDLDERGEDDVFAELESRGLLSGISKAANKIKGGAPAAKKIDTRPARTPNKLQKKPPVAKPPKVAKPTNKLQKKPPKNIGKNFRRDFEDDHVVAFARDIVLADLESRANGKSGGRRLKAGGSRRQGKFGKGKLSRKLKKVKAEESE